MADIPGEDGYFDQRIAATYDEDNAPLFDAGVVGPTVDFLAALAGTGRALELASGTGRIAVPLAKRGVEVAGIELSRAMTARLRAKPGGDAIPVTIGDMTKAKAGGTFRVAYLLRNTIMNLTTRDAQVECFRNVGEQLEPGGTFVIEVGVPGLQRLPPGETFQVFTWTDGHWGIDEYDVERQGLISHHFRRVRDQIELQSVPFRYVWPSELDLMAQMAGLELRERWDGWTREPFTSESGQHVSVWQKPAGAGTVGDAG